MVTANHRYVIGLNEADWMWLMSGLMCDQTAALKIVATTIEPPSLTNVVITSSMSDHSPPPSLPPPSRHILPRCVSWPTGNIIKLKSDTWNVSSEPWKEKSRQWLDLNLNQTTDKGIKCWEKLIVLFCFSFSFLFFFCCFCCCCCCCCCYCRRGGEGAGERRGKLWWPNLPIEVRWKNINADKQKQRLFCVVLLC